MLSLRERAARLTGDPEALRAIESARAVLRAPGPQPPRPARDPAPTPELERQPEPKHKRQPERETREQRRERWRADWVARPHGRLAPGELTRAIGAAEQRQARERAAAETVRREVTEREPAVAAGRGPRVAALDAERDRLRQRAEVQARAEDIERRWRAVVQRAGDAAERRAQAEFDAQRTRRWQSGKRERLTVEAAEHRAEVQRAQDEAKELARRAAELQQELGGRQVWRLAREQAERAEARYPEERTEAQRADEADLTRAGDRVARLDRSVAEAGDRADELSAEQQLRQAMPQPQRIAEGFWRIEANRQDMVRAIERAAEVEAEPEIAGPEVDLEWDYHARTMDRGIDIDRDGPSLGW